MAGTKNRIRTLLSSLLRSTCLSLPASRNRYEEIHQERLRLVYPLKRLKFLRLARSDLCATSIPHIDVHLLGSVPCQEEHRQYLSSVFQRYTELKIIQLECFKRTWMKTQKDLCFRRLEISLETEILKITKIIFVLRYFYDISVLFIGVIPFWLMEPVRWTYRWSRHDQTWDKEAPECLVFVVHCGNCYRYSNQNGAIRRRYGAFAICEWSMKHLRERNLIL